MSSATQRAASIGVNLLLENIRTSGLSENSFSLEGCDSQYKVNDLYLVLGTAYRTTAEERNSYQRLCQMPPEILSLIWDWLLIDCVVEQEELLLVQYVKSTCRLLRASMADRRPDIYVTKMSAGALSMAAHQLGASCLKTNRGLHFCVDSRATINYPHPTYARLDQDNFITREESFSCTPTHTQWVDSPSGTLPTVNRRNWRSAAMQRKCDEAIAAVKKAVLDCPDNLRVVDLNFHVDLLPAWPHLLRGKRDNLRTVRVWAMPRPNPLPVFALSSAASLTKLILKNCIPPDCEDWGVNNIQYLVVEGLQEEEWPAERMLKFLGLCPRLRFVVFDGRFTMYNEPTPLEHPVPLSNLESIVLGASWGWWGDLSPLPFNPARVFPLGLLGDLTLSKQRHTIALAGISSVEGTLNLNLLPEYLTSGVHHVVLVPLHSDGHNGSIGFFRDTLYVEEGLSIMPFRGPEIIWVQEAPTLDRIAAVIEGFPDLVEFHFPIPAENGAYAEAEEALNDLLPLLVQQRKKVTLYTTHSEEEWPNKPDEVILQRGPLPLPPFCQMDIMGI